MALDTYILLSGGNANSFHTYLCSFNQLNQVNLQRCASPRSPYFVTFFCDLRGPALAEGSYSIGPPARGISRKHSTKFNVREDAQHCTLLGVPSFDRF